MARALLFQSITEDETKFVPVAVRVIAGLPVEAEFGLIDVSVGAGFVDDWIVKVAPPDVPPPGAGLMTMTVAVPVLARAAAGTCAVSVVAFVYDVLSTVPFHRMVEDEMKFVPVAVRVMAELPSTAAFGLIELSVGAGFAVDWIVKVTPPDVPPPGAGFDTVTVAVPVDARSEAGTCAVSVAELT